MIPVLSPYSLLVLVVVERIHPGYRTIPHWTSLGARLACERIVPMEKTGVRLPKIWLARQKQHSK